MPKQPCGIYKIENLINAKKYIGQSVNIYKRWKQHKYVAFRKESEEYEKPLYRSIRKYGIENFSFEILELCEPELLNDREIYWIDYYDSYNNEKGYNLTIGGNQTIKIDIQGLKDKWDEGYTVGELIKEFGYNKQTISKYLNGYSDYNRVNSQRRSALKARYKKIEKRIVQYTMDGIEVKRWSSISQIKRELKIYGVSNCLRGEYYSSGGFRWGYEGDVLITKNNLIEKSKSTILTEEDVKEIKLLIAQGLKQSTIAEKYNISRWEISSINTGKHWRDNDVYPIYDYKKKKSNRN